MSKKIFLKFAVIGLENMVFLLGLVFDYRFYYDFSEFLEFKKNQRFKNIKALYLNNLDFYIKDNK